VNLHCEATGAGRDLVLLHPVGLDHTFWRSLTSAASPSHRVLAIDLRGHGRSPAAGRDTSFDQYVDDIHETIAANCNGLAIVLGLSFGGMLAQMLALRHPKDVDALVLCGCPGGFADEVRPVLRERGLAAERGGMEAVVAPTIERWFTPAFRENQDVERVRERLRSDDVVSWSAAWHAISAFHALPRLSEISVPCVVIAGDVDAATPLAAATKLAASIPGARLHVLAGAPHMMQIECRDAYNAAVMQFLGAIDG
jgi:3-oxoadipate enol-lactonase